MRAIVLRGPQTAAGVLVHRHGTVLRAGDLHPRCHRGLVNGPVVPVRRHVVRVQQFAGRARIPVDDDMRAVIDPDQGGWWQSAGVLRLSDHVCCAEGVPARSGHAICSRRLPVFRYHVVADGRLRVLRRARNAGKEFPRN